MAQTLGRLRAGGRAFVDLTESNPTRAGFDYPPDPARAAGRRPALAYDPRPFGLEDARRAVAADYARRGIEVAAERIVLTASTSEAYSLLFKVLGDPGDEVLVPAPAIRCSIT